MKSVLTGDIINSQSVDTEIWHQALKEVFSSEDANNWEIYRGDEFQCLLENAEDAFKKAIEIKSKIRKIPGLDVRISIGTGSQDFIGEKVSQSTGTAFVHSGRNFEKIKAQKINLSISSGNIETDEVLNLIFKWLSNTTDNWSVVSAEIVDIFLKDPNINQELVAQKLNISQSSISQRLKRADFDLILETDRFFRKKMAEL
ncbi:SatD family protein [Chryseobacterium sp.]|uniref:SatD family protein n=1 Tax=Chryseobacterium sp. TaxID=1871047 RepID=UPI0011C70650|nr:SatD family protein [Chryseobacterium sp.]TXF79406.1 winged helix-turn-helix transcriptional regulator [Chryseobacterium sp.]